MIHASGHSLSGQSLASRRKPIDPIILFAAEGALFQLFTSINGFANNLFATELGATDQQIGLIQTVPNVAALLLLLPLGILADRLRSSRSIPLISLLCVAAGYLVMAAVPSLGQFRMVAFFCALAFTVGGPVLYNAQWQTFFGDVVTPSNRNAALTLRNRMMFSIGIITPLVCGMAMTGTVSAIRIYQIFFLLCALATLIQAAVVSFIQTPARQPVASGFSVRELAGAVRLMAASKPFCMFFIPVLLFYMTWQMDWSMWYIGQVQYLQLTQSQITIYNGVFNIGQLVAIGVLSKVVQRRGTDRTLPYAALGLISCPMIMIVCSRLPQIYRMPSFTVMMAVLNAPQCAVNLCIVQILLRVVPKQCRSIAVSLYTLTITLTNCFMPYLGVRMYEAMGADYRALILFCITVLLCRTATYLLLLWRCRYCPKEEE